MPALKNYTVKPVDNSTWNDFEKLFESEGSPHHCWCMVWHIKRSNSDKQWRKNQMHESVKKKVPIGLLAYSGKEPVAWCSVAPRNTYKALGGDETIDNVWSLVCFFIKREYRGKGISKLLIEKASDYASKNGAGYLEAYPVSSDSHSYRFMGFVPVFEKLGFRFVKMAGSKRHVMLLEL